MKNLWRKLHRYVALAVLIPMTIIAVTGTVLLYRNQFEFIQPSAVKSESVEGSQLLTLESITEQFGKENIEQIIYKPSKGTLAVRLLDATEAQIHPQTGEVLKSAKRRTNFLIELHQGSWMGAFGQLGIHFLGGLGLIFLIVSGIVIYPFKRKRA